MWPSGTKRLLLRIHHRSPPSCSKHAYTALGATLLIDVDMVSGSAYWDNVDISRHQSRTIATALLNLTLESFD
jgi:hypothetical protein